MWKAKFMFRLASTWKHHTGPDKSLSLSWTEGLHKRDTKSLGQLGITACTQPGAEQLTQYLCPTGKDFFDHTDLNITS